MIGQTFTLIGSPKLVFRLVWRGSIAGIDCVRGVAVNDHRLKAVASAYGLKPDWVGPGGRLASWLDNFEVVVRYLGLLILNIFLPHLVRHIAARRHPIAPTPEMLTPIPFAKRLIFRQQFVRALAFEILHRPRYR